VIEIATIVEMNEKIVGCARSLALLLALTWKQSIWRLPLLLPWNTLLASELLSWIARF
jgi:hypothetical protein